MTIQEPQKKKIDWGGACGELQEKQMESIDHLK